MVCTCALQQQLKISTRTFFLHCSCIAHVKTPAIKCCAIIARVLQAHNAIFLVQQIIHEAHFVAVNQRAVLQAQTMPAQVCNYIAYELRKLCYLRCRNQELTRPKQSSPVNYNKPFHLPYLNYASIFIKDLLVLVKSYWINFIWKYWCLRTLSCLGDSNFWLPSSAEEVKFQVG